MTEEQITALHEVEAGSPPNQESISGKLETGEPVEAVRYDVEEDGAQVLKYKVNFLGKHYMADVIPQENPSEFVFKLK